MPLSPKLWCIYFACKFVELSLSICKVFVDIYGVVSISVGGDCCKASTWHRSHCLFLAATILTPMSNPKTTELHPPNHNERPRTCPATDSKSKMQTSNVRRYPLGVMQLLLADGLEGAEKLLDPLQQIRDLLSRSRGCLARRVRQKPRSSLGQISPKPCRILP